MKKTVQKESRRIRRELDTVRVMIGMYCRAHHRTSGQLCAECEDLWEYVTQRVDRCPFGHQKPTCAKCSVHCFNAKRREKIREIMRYAGPRMSLRHPVYTLFHFLDGRRSTPERKRKPKSSEASKRNDA